MSSKIQSAPVGMFVKAGFGAGIGSLLAIMIFMALGIGLFIGGFILVKSQTKKPKEQQNKTYLITGYILMVLGMIIGLGFGATVFFGMLSESV